MNVERPQEAPSLPCCRLFSSGNSSEHYRGSTLTSAPMPTVCPALFGRVAPAGREAGCIRLLCGVEATLCIVDGRPPGARRGPEWQSQGRN